MKSKRSMLGVAIWAMGSAASAQSSLTVFGVVDAAVSGFSNKSRDSRNPTLARPGDLNRGDVEVSSKMLRNSGYNSSRVGFRGTEDLGGGLAASFWLEAPITNDDGQTGIFAFSRRSTVSLSGPFGEIRLGRDYSPTFWNDSAADPWNQVGGGSSLMSAALGLVSAGNGFATNQNYARASNSVGYFLPPGLGGFYGQVMYVFNENAGYSPGNLTPPGVNANGGVNPGQVTPSQAGRYAGGRLGYASGPLDVAIAYGQSNLSDSFYAGTTDLVKIANVAAIYDFGVAKVSAELSRSTFERKYEVAPATGRVPDVDVRGFLIGATVPVGAGLIRASYSRVTYDRHPSKSPFGPSLGNPQASKLALGYIHNLSKRTALYATLSHIRNKNDAALTVNGGPSFYSDPAFTPRTSTGYDLGIRFAF